MRAGPGAARAAADGRAALGAARAAAAGDARAVGARESRRESPRHLHRRRADRADPEPGRCLPAASAVAPRARCACRLSRILPRRWPASASCSPTLSPTRSRRSATTVPHLISEANKSLLELQHTLNQHGIHVHTHQAGQDGAADARRQGRQRIELDRVLRRRRADAKPSAPASTSCSCFVLSVYMLLYGQTHRPARPPLMPDGDGTPADDYPELVQHARRPLRRRAAAVQRHHGLDRRPRAVRLRRARDLPRRSPATRSCSASSTA